MEQPELDTRELMRQQMRQQFTPRAMVDSGAPVLAFALAVPFSTVRIASFIALGIGVALALERAARRKSVQQVLAGLLGLGIAVAVANFTGKAKGFYLVGILQTVGLALALWVSLVVRRPVVGVFVSLLDTKCQGWRERPVLRRAFTRITLFAALFYTVKAVLGVVLYATDHANGLAGVRLALGLPPYLLLIAYGYTQVQGALASESSESSESAESEDVRPATS